MALAWVANGALLPGTVISAGFGVVAAALPAPVIMAATAKALAATVLSATDLDMRIPSTY
jgi:hypothetical protein